MRENVCSSSISTRMQSVCPFDCSDCMPDRDLTSDCGGTREMESGMRNLRSGGKRDEMEREKE